MISTRTNWPPRGAARSRPEWASRWSKPTLRRSHWPPAARTWWSASTAPASGAIRGAGAGGLGSCALGSAGLPGQQRAVHAVRSWMPDPRRRLCNAAICGSGTYDLRRRRVPPVTFRWIAALTASGFAVVPSARTDGLAPPMRRTTSSTRSPTCSGRSAGRRRDLWVARRVGSCVVTDMRASDADRDRYAGGPSGRLRIGGPPRRAEYDERLEAVSVCAAKTYADLEPLIADLPVSNLPVVKPAAAGPRGPRRATPMVAVFSAVSARAGLWRPTPTPSRCSAAWNSTCGRRRSRRCPVRSARSPCSAAWRSPSPRDACGDHRRRGVRGLPVRRHVSSPIRSSRRSGSRASRCSAVSSVKSRPGR